MAEGLYRVGECVYMEVYPPPTPYQVCKIEELRKNSKGGVEVACKCFYRRRDLPQHLLGLADQHALALEEENNEEGYPPGSYVEELSSIKLHLIKHRELFLSRQIETYKIDMVRGKCTVYLLNELDHLACYLEKEDFFFYSMVYDPNQRNLMVDKGEIRVGEDYQAEIPPLTASSDSQSKEDDASVETQVWEPGKLSDQEVEQYLVVARSVGTFARALLDGSRKPQISLRLGAAAASRDITLFHGMDTLHKSTYKIGDAVAQLVPRGPLLCADELESWTQDEAKRFEDGLQEYKDFYYIQKKHLPWKSIKSIVSYYYFWKTTDRYQIQKRHRMIEKQNDLKEVIVHLRSNGPPTAPRDLSGKAATSGQLPNEIPTNKTGPPQLADGKGCESCFTSTASRWYSWGPPQEQCRLCDLCMVYWRKYGGLKLVTKWEVSDKSCSFAAILSKNRSSKGGKSSTRHPYKSRKKPTLRPQNPFTIQPNSETLLLRKSLGNSILRKHARAISKEIAVPESSIPSVEVVTASVHRTSVRIGKTVVVKGKMNGIVAKLRQCPSPSPVKTLIKVPSTVSPITPPLRKMFQHQPQIISSAKTNGGQDYVEDVKTGVVRKRKGETSESPLAKIRKSVPTNSAGDNPISDYFFQADNDLKKLRDKVGRPALIKTARTPTKKPLED